MISVLIAAAFSMIGIMLGGALRAWETHHARKLESEALLTALVAEVEALTRLIGHRQYIESLSEVQRKAQIQIQAGEGLFDAEFIVMDLKHNYFVTYEASVDKIGMIDPYWADRITRFYTFIKAVTENYHPTSPYQAGLSAHVANEVIANDLALLHTVVALGNHISTDVRILVPPAGVSSPFPVININQPPLPQTNTRLANEESAGNSGQEA